MVILPRWSSKRANDFIVDAFILFDMARTRFVGCIIRLGTKVIAQIKHREPDYMVRKAFGLTPCRSLNCCRFICKFSTWEMIHYFVLWHLLLCLLTLWMNAIVISDDDNVSISSYDGVCFACIQVGWKLNKEMSAIFSPISTWNTLKEHILAHKKQSSSVVCIS